MATFLDVSGLAAFSKIFVFLLVLVGAYVILATSRIGTHNWIAWLVAFILGIFVLISDLATQIIEAISPWIGLMLVLVMFIMVAGKLMGATQTDFIEFKWVLLALTVAIFLVGTFYVMRAKTTLPGDLDEDEKELKDGSFFTTPNFILHPKVIGIVFILLVAIFTVGLLAGKT